MLWLCAAGDICRSESDESGISSAGSDSEAEMDASDVDDDVRANVKAALGDAAVASDAEV